MKPIRIVVSNTGVPIFKSCLSNILNGDFLACLPGLLLGGGVRQHHLPPTTVCA